ncbi:WD repeat-containing protein 43 isoform X1 [Octopus sinensis]|uniref:WD repeat-containing protein 43 isoform X1 n=1 Tax=Octopus sinensis TaxID=2607531 RepID=A0A6P7SWP1_9MOLL|nr:WD repeat-containing protein 43 isoform X1 [Octopus sinensis]
MMAATEVVKFSPNGNYLIHSSVDGIIKVWETQTGTLKDEFTPSSHLAATCSCLAWHPSVRSPESLPKSKKRKKSLDETTSTAESLNLVALGTTAGNVFLYSVLKGDVHSRLENGHSLIVNDICWHPERNVLYTCSSDQYIAEWDLSLGKVNHKWKASNNILQSICLPSKNTLISAGNLIKLWDLDKYEVIKKFNGHATEVLQLLPVVTDPKQHESSYFLSAAVNDRLISAWAINSNKDEKNAIASFSLPDEPKTLALSNLKDQAICLSVVTKSGQLLIFEHVLNGKMKKPIRPKVTIKVVKSSSGKTLPILVSYPTQDKDGTILLAHSSFIKPVFERVASKNMTGEITVEHKPSLPSQFSGSNAQKVILGEVSKDTTILTPSHMVSSGPKVENNTHFLSKKKRISELSLQDRLKAINYDQSVEVPTTNQPPLADSMAVLLTQGLTSEDRSILDNVLRKEHSEAIIQNTVRKLNIQAVIPLMNELSRRMSKPHLVLPIYVQWVKVILSIHTSYLMSFPDLIDSLSSLHRLLDTRVAMFSKLTRLQGKLGLLLSQLTSRHQDEQGDTQQEQHPLLVYQDASSDEEMYFRKNLDDAMPCESGSEYDWNTSDEEDRDDSESAKPNETDEKDESD